MPKHILMDIFKDNKGVSLIETVVGLSILGVAGIVFLFGLSNSITGERIHREQATAQVLASSAVEFVRSQPYSDTAWSYTVSSSTRSHDVAPSWWDVDNPPLLEQEYSQYSVEVSAEDFDTDNDSTIEVPGDDDSIRKITVSVYDNTGDLLLNLENYKASQ